MKALLVIALVLTASVAAAQDRLFIGSREVGTAGRFGQDVGPAPGAIAFPRIGGERYIVTHTEIIDAMSGVRLPRPEGVIVAYDRARPRVFVMRYEGVWSHDVVSRFEVLVIARETVDLTGCVHAASADVLLCAFIRDGRHELVRSGSAGAQLVATAILAEPTGRPDYGLGTQWFITPDGTRSYFDECVADDPVYRCAQQRVSWLDLSTGVITGQGLYTPFTGAPRMVYDESRRRLYLIGQRIDVLNADLAVIGSATVSGRCQALAISPHTGRAYLNKMDYDYGIPAYGILTAFDGGSYAKLQGETVRASAAECGPLSLLTAPGAPQGVTAHVDDHTVTLAWTNIGAASQFVVEAGLARGRADFIFYLHGAEPFTQFSHVPSGTYHLRIRGGNLIGGGHASREIVVRVP